MGITRKLFAAVLVGSLLLTPGVRAADADFVGVLALAVDDADVAKQLGLTDDAKAKLQSLIDMREDLILKAGLDKLPDDEKQAKMAAFVAESEKLGLALLTKPQQTKLMQIRIARGGLATLEEAAVAEAVGLDGPQQRNIQKMLAGLKGKLAAGTEEERRVAKNDVERELGKILTKDQRTKWDVLAGLAEGGAEDKPEKPAKEPGKEKPENEPADNGDKPAKPESKPGKPETKPGKPELNKERPPKNIEDVRLKFNFAYTPYKDVLEWLAKEADLSLIADPIPPGTFNYRDNKSYTVPKAIDLINSVLLTRGYTIVLRERLLFVFAVEDGLPPWFTRMVKPEDLDKCGEFELVGCLFAFTKATPEDVEADVRKVVGIQSAVVVIAKSKQLYVQDTAGKLRTIRAIIEALEDPQRGQGGDQIAMIKLKHKLPDDILTTARPLMGIPEGLNATPDGSFRIAPITGGFMIKGKQEQVDKFKELVDKLEGDADDEVDPTPPEQPQVVVYAITSADPDAVLPVLQTVMAGQLNVRIAKDPKSGNIVAHGTPSQHATMKALIDEMQKDPRDFKVIKLRKLDPEEVVAELNKIFGIVEGATNTSAPRIVANTTMSHISVSGSKQQIDQIKAHIIEMGETLTNGDPSMRERSYNRSFSLTGRARDSALSQLETLLPVYLANPIRVVPLTAAAGDKGIPSRVPVPKDLEKRMSKPAETKPKTAPGKTEDRGEDRGRTDDRDRGDRRPEGDRSRRDDERRRDEERRSLRTPPQRFYYVAWQDPELTPKANVKKSKETAGDQGDEPAKEATESSDQQEAPPKQKTTPGAEIVITVTQNGIIVSSQDLDALDRVEDFIRSIEDPKGGGKEYTIFYLRFARADVAADLLSQALGGGGGDEGGGGSLMGDMMGSMLGGGGMGGLMGSLLGGGGGGASSVSSGPVMLIPDNRLNAILAQGKPGDLDLAESLLKIIDQQASIVKPEVIPKPRFIPVYHTTADDMAAILQKVYAPRMAADPNVQRQPSPQEMMQALRGGGGRGGGGGKKKESEEQKMTIGVDSKSNSLIVSAPPALFEEVEQMVKDLDIASTNKDESISVLSLKGTNPTLIERSLGSILGDDVTITVLGSSTSTAARTPARNARSNTTAPPPGQPQGNPQQQQAANFMRAMQQGGGGLPQGFNPGGGGGGGPGGGGRGGGRGGAGGFGS